MRLRAEFSSKASGFPSFAYAQRLHFAYFWPLAKPCAHSRLRCENRLHAQRLRGRTYAFGVTCGRSGLRSTSLESRSTPLVLLTRLTAFRATCLALRRERTPSIACASLDSPNRGRRVASGSFVLAAATLIALASTTFSIHEASQREYRETVLPPIDKGIPRFWQQGKLCKYFDKF